MAKKKNLVSEDPVTSKEDLTTIERIKEIMANSNGASVVLDARIANAKTFLYSSTVTELIEYAEHCADWAYQINNFLLSRSAKKLTPDQRNTLMLRMSMFEKLEKRAIREIPKVKSTEKTGNPIIAILELFKMKDGGDGIVSANQDEVASKYGWHAAGSGRTLAAAFRKMRAKPWEERPVDESVVLNFYKAYQILQEDRPKHPKGSAAILAEWKYLHERLKKNPPDWLRNKQPGFLDSIQ